MFSNLCSFFNPKFSSATNLNINSAEDQPINSALSEGNLQKCCTGMQETNQFGNHGFTSNDQSAQTQFCTLEKIKLNGNIPDIEDFLKGFLNSTDVTAFHELFEKYAKIGTGHKYSADICEWNILSWFKDSGIIGTIITVPEADIIFSKISEKKPKISKEEFLLLIIELCLIKNQCFSYVMKLLLSKHLLNDMPPSLNIERTNDVFMNHYIYDENRLSLRSVLVFDAFYCDPLGELDKSTTRYRKCKVLYFLEDDALAVYEPMEKNNGLHQGIIVQKGRFYKPEGGYYTTDDLNVGKTLVLFGREYKLTNCDNFTRNFLTEMGYKVRSPEPEIQDQIAKDRNESSDEKFHKSQRFVFRNGLPTEEDTEKKVPKIPAADRLLGRNPFKDSNAPVLVFDAFYCDPLGELDKSTTRYRKCKVLYFLEDDALAVYEPMEKNNGLHQGIIVQKGRFYKPEGGYYTTDDLNVGKTLVLFGREYKLTNCDNFTRNFLTEMGYKVRSPEPEIQDQIAKDRNEGCQKIKKESTITDAISPEKRFIKNQEELKIKQGLELISFLDNLKFSNDLYKMKKKAKIEVQKPCNSIEKKQQAFVKSELTTFLLQLNNAIRVKPLLPMVKNDLIIKRKSVDLLEAHFKCKKYVCIKQIDLLLEILHYNLHERILFLS